MEYTKKSNNVATVKFINLTPHAINFNDGRVIPAIVSNPKEAARVEARFSEFDSNGICRQEFGEIINLPEPEDGVKYIVSALVLSAAKAQGRTDCVAPATGHPDCKRSEDGKIILSVPGFVE
ncbi:MAG: hypothetical protein J6N49_05440 [Alphaproteobacteria bacterium]|nr:hypothetical protein [Alphaproteobacteria bacterium]